MSGEEAWVPKSRDDWEDVFAGGMNKFMSAREEAEAKARAEEAKNNPPASEGKEGGGENGDNGTDTKRPNAFDSFAARLLGGPA